MSSEEMEDYRRSIPLLKYNFILDTSLIHLVVTLPGKEEIILYRKGSCGCFPCLSGISEECESLEKFKEHPSFIQMVKRTFLVKGDQRGKAPNDEEDEFELDEGERNECDEMFIEMEASKYTQQDDLAVIKTGDDHPYYLLKVTCN